MCDNQVKHYNKRCKGAKGLHGVKGLQGLRGIDGLDGVNGRDGIDGRNGVNGLDGINCLSDFTTPYLFSYVNAIQIINEYADINFSNYTNNAILYNGTTAIIENDGNYFINFIILIISTHEQTITANIIVNDVILFTKVF